MKKYPKIVLDLRQYIYDLKIRSHTLTTFLPEFWPQEDVREINVLDKIVTELEQIIIDNEELNT